MAITPDWQPDFNNSQEPLIDRSQAAPISIDSGELHTHDEDCDDYLPIVDGEQTANDIQLGTVGSSTTTLASVTTVLDLSQTFSLSSLASANHTIYLDFDGYTTSGTYWNDTTRPNIVTPAYSLDTDTTTFTSAELTAIQYIWQRVAEDFSPFNVNVTTKAPTDLNDLIKSGTGDTRWGIRVAIGGSSTDWYGSAGGVAYLDSFNWNTDTPAFVFENQLGNGDEKYTAEAISHEVGHALGLNHDGRISPSEGYYGGHGTGDTGWASIMGVGYNKNLSQWSKGQYTSASNTEDDLQMITSNNGFGYRVDDAGNTMATAKALTINGAIVSGSGIIERNTDVDYYSFVAGAGTINLNINPFNRGPNLDILAELYSADGTLIASSNPTTLLSATISTTLATAGIYYLKIDGVGSGDPLATGYTDYGSLGQYFISGDVGLSNLPGISLSVSPASVQEDSATNLVYTFTRTGSTTTALSVNYNVNSTAAFGTDYTQSGASSFTATGGSITFAAGSSTAILTLDPTTDNTIESNETIAVTLASDPNYIVVTPTAASGTIVNDDTQVVTLALSSTSVLEDGSANLVYTFSRVGDTATALSVNYQVAGTATFGTDYSQIGGNSFTSTAGKIDFAAGSSTATLTIDPTADATRESNETIALTLVANTGYAIGTTTAVTGTIIDDDKPTISVSLSPPSVLEDGNTNLVYTFTRTGALSNSLTVNYGVGGTATFKTDYTPLGAASFKSNSGTITFAANSNTAILTIDPKADTTRESNETVIVTLRASTAYNIGTSASVVGTIVNDEFAAASALAPTQAKFALSPTNLDPSTPAELSLDLTEMVLPLTKVAFNVEREAMFDNTVSFYRTLDAEGSIQSSHGILKPTDAGYIEAALANALESGIDLGAENNGNANIIANLEQSFYMPIMVANGTLAEAASGQKLDRTYTAFSGANADKTEHIRLLGDNTFGFEDMFGGGDRDYNDLIVKMVVG
jgi:hypothetical protein